MKKYRVEIWHYEGYELDTKRIGDILEFDRVGLTSLDWDIIIQALRRNLATYDTDVIAYIYADDHYTALASLWRDIFDSSFLHLDMVQDGKYLEIRTFKEVE